MFKLSRVLPSSCSRHQLLEVLSSRKVEVRDCLRHRHDTYSAGFSTATNNYAAKGYTSDRIFAPYCVYKGKAAFSLSPCLPTFTKLDSGVVVVERRGSMMMIFMHAVGERKYDREKKQRFALSATEVGSLITMGPQDSCEFFHDPAMLSSNAGQVRKSLSIKANNNGYFVSLTVVNNLLNTKEYFNVPVTTAEFAVMKTACSFALPHIMGWDRLTNQQSRGTVGGTVGFQSKVDPQVLDLEWEK
ncbi:single-stranded DNA-binding protein WHY2, mitochondrial [Gastrolobium bilobum]|uniref:single-stranded DNA-binding protein WHY2, mitochondrial n=1 Tax=Gastrolobium bilobum TaxID=150636 RepID=UPI002AB090AC|nr:single-stranded DNA-binding protein WHY2, mitochondrial [Gastrolobium bilobum]